MTDSRRLAGDEQELPDVHDVPVSPARVFASGLALAGAVMLIAEMFMALILRQLELLLLAAVVTGAYLLTAGVAVGLLVGRLTRRWPLRKASLAFFVAGLVSGGLWGFPVFALLANEAAQATGSEPASTSGALLGAAYVASTAGMGALAGRWLGPFVATRPRLTGMIAGVVALVVLGSLALLTLVNFQEL